MPFTFRCPSCGIALTADEQNIGRIGRCPKCRHEFEVARSTAQPARDETNSPPGLQPNLLRTDSITGKQLWFESYDLGAEDHRGLKLLCYSDFLALSFEERRRAFTVPRVNDLNTVRAIHKLLHVDFDSDHGRDFRAFLKRVKQFFGGALPAPITDDGLGKVYRRSTVAMLTRGQEQLVENHGLNSEVFPLSTFSAPPHMMLDHRLPTLRGKAAGSMAPPYIGGTTRFCNASCRRSLDSCRCCTIAMTIERAAEKGVEEARRWMRTGTPPERPHWVKWPDIDPRWELEDEEFAEDDIPDLIAQSKHKDLVVRAGAFWALSGVTSAMAEDSRIPAGAETLASTLNAALHDPNGFIQNAAAESLANLAETRLEIQGRVAELQAAIGMLRDAGSAKRLAAAQTLGRIGAETWADLGAAGRKAAAAQTLRTIGASDKLAIRALITALRDDDAQVRSKSAYALGQMRALAVTGVPALVELLDDGLAHVRRSAVWALLKIGPAARDAVPAVMKKLNDPSKSVREAAAVAVRVLNQEGAP